MTVKKHQAQKKTQIAPKNLITAHAAPFLIMLVLAVAGSAENKMPNKFVIILALAELKYVFILFQNFSGFNLFSQFYKS